MTGSDDLLRTYRRTALVCGALAVSVLIYAILVEVLRTRLPPAGVGLDVSVLRYVFYLVAGIEGLSIPVARRAAEAGGSVAARRADFYVLASWSLLLHLFHFPRYERWEEAAKTAARQPG